jgi:tRNA 5-methylaminomethyl-2-thiouridine biosynthesis bifunctional protein
LQLLAELAPELLNEWKDADLQGRAALRCTTPDHLPMAGALPDRESFLRDYTALRSNAKSVIATRGTYIEGLWILAGFGGRGLCYIPLAAELLASQLLQQPAPLTRNIQMALSPARFVIRELIRVNSQPRV